MSKFTSLISVAILSSLFFLFTAFSPTSFFDNNHIESTVAPPCTQDTALSDFVIATDLTIKVAKEIISAQTILENSNIVYSSGSGTTLTFGMTGSLSGPSPGFQIYNGSTLEILIATDCS